MEHEAEGVTERERVWNDPSRLRRRSQVGLSFEVPSKRTGLGKGRAMT
jgi:hypothetical protein